MEKSNIKKNIGYQMIYEVLVILLPFITSPYISRVLGVENLGEYSYSYSIAYYFVLISMLGIKNYGNREIARVRDDKKLLNKSFSNIFAVHSLFSCACCIAYVFYIISLGDKCLYAAIQGALVLSALFDISWFYFGIEKFKLTVTRDTIVKICTVSSIFLFVHKTDDLWKYCVIMSVGTLLSQLALWLPIRKYVKFEKPDWKEMTIHIKPLFVLFIPALAVSLYKYMDKIMIGLLSGKAELGYYENAEKAINIPLTLISAFGTVMLPKMSNLAASKDIRSSERYMNLSMQFIMALSFALAFGLAGVGKIFAPVFWGNSFIRSGYLIMGLATTIPFIAFANIIRTQYLIPNKRDKEYLLSVIVGAIINLVINTVLIPRYGAIGAVVGTIMAEMTVCLVQTVVIRHELPLKKYFNSFKSFFIFGIVMFGVLIFIEIQRERSIYTLLLQIAIGGGLYILCCGIYLYKEKNEFFMSVLSRVRIKDANH